MELYHPLTRQEIEVSDAEPWIDAGWLTTPPDAPETPTDQNEEG
ncbi:MAG: hypothetical protein QM708_12060 [Propioniciclava sp.]